MRFWTIMTAVSAGVLLAALIGFARTTLAPAQGAPDSIGNLTVTVSETSLTSLTGVEVTFTSEVRNEGPETTPPLLANLSFVSLDQSTYMDPEDWSGRRSTAIGTIAPGESAIQSWTVNPVLAGEIGVYVTVLPQSEDLVSTGPLAASPGVYLHVDEERSLNPGGVLPVVLAVPAALALGFVGLRLARGRLA